MAFGGTAAPGIRQARPGYSAGHADIRRQGPVSAKRFPTAMPGHSAGTRDFRPEIGPEFALKLRCATGRRPEIRPVTAQGFGMTVVTLVVVAVTTGLGPPHPATTSTAITADAKIPRPVTVCISQPPEKLWSSARPVTSG